MKFNLYPKIEISIVFTNKEFACIKKHLNNSEYRYDSLHPDGWFFKISRRRRWMGSKAELEISFRNLDKVGKMLEMPAFCGGDKTALQLLVNINAILKATNSKYGDIKGHFTNKFTSL